MQKLTIDNFETLFFKKQKRLFAAIEKQKQLYNKYLSDLNNWDSLHDWDFNLLHDLEYRLTQRIQDLQDKYYSLHWEKYQFNAY